MTLLAVNKKGVEIACNYNLYRLGNEWTTLINDEWKFGRLHSRTPERNN